MRGKGDHELVESKISSKGRTTLPKSVREALGAKPGDRVRYFVQGDEVRIKPVRPLARLFGTLKGTVTISKDTDLTSPLDEEWDAER